MPRPFTDRVWNLNMKIYMCGSSYDNLHMGISIWRFCYERTRYDNLHMGIFMGRCPHDDHHMIIFIYRFPDNDLHMRISIWGSTYEQAHMRMPIWRSTYQYPHIKTYMRITFSYEDLHMRICICWIRNVWKICIYEIFYI